MQALYRLRERTAGMTKAEALRQAQNLFIKGELQAGTNTNAATSISPATDNYRHPFYWAPFILMGNWL